MLSEVFISIIIGVGGFFQISGLVCTLGGSFPIIPLRLIATLHTNSADIFTVIIVKIDHPQASVNQDLISDHLLHVLSSLQLSLSDRDLGAASP